MAQVASHWIFTMAAQIRTQVSRVGFVVDKMALGQTFPKFFGLPCQYKPTAAPYSFMYRLGAEQWAC
jgi:hypothetical protein